VDDAAEAACADRVDVQPGEEVLGVGLAHASGVRDRADVAEAHPAKLPAREVLLDLLLQSRREWAARLLEEADLHQLWIGLSGSDVEAGLVALALQQVARDRRGQHAQVRDLETG